MNKTNSPLPFSTKPAMSFSKDPETGRYFSCNQAFAEYAHKSSPADVIGLTDAELFDHETVRHLYVEDKRTLSSDAPYTCY